MVRFRLLNDPYSNDQFSSMYVKSHNRAAPYIIGIIAAYIATKLKEANYRFSTVNTETLICVLVIV